MLAGFFCADNGTGSLLHEQGKKPIMICSWYVVLSESIGSVKTDGPTAEQALTITYRRCRRQMG